MSKRSERREAERVARKAAYQELRRQNSQPATTTNFTQSKETIMTEPITTEMPTPTSLSTGPTSATGKQISSRNALKHGCCADHILVLPHETMEAYKSIEKMYLDEYKPKGELEQSMVQQIINSHWFHERATHAVNECEAQIHDSGYMLKNWSDQNHLSLARFLRYQTTRANTLRRAIKALEDHRKNRLNETIKIETHEIRKEKARPKPTIEEMLDDMDTWMPKTNPKRPTPPLSEPLIDRFPDSTKKR